MSDDVKLTGETITDEQIRDWESDVLSNGATREKARAVDLATKALALTPTLQQAFAAFAARDRDDHSDPRSDIRRQEQRRKYSRARIAEILNARNGASS